MVYDEVEAMGRGQLSIKTVVGLGKEYFILNAMVTVEQASGGQWLAPVCVGQRFLRLCGE